MWQLNVSRVSLRSRSFLQLNVGMTTCYSEQVHFSDPVFVVKMCSCGGLVCLSAGSIGCMLEDGEKALLCTCSEMAREQSM